MKFIRDIISEKRGVRPASMPLPPQTLDDEVFETAAPADRFGETLQAAPRAFALPEPDVEIEEMNLFAAVDDAEGEQDQSFESELSAWINGDDALADDTAPAPLEASLAQTSYDDEQDMAEFEPEAPEPAAVMEAEAPAPSTAGTLLLGAGSRLGPKPVSPFEKLRALETQRAEAKAARLPDAPPRQPADEARLRLAMKSDDYLAAARSTPMFPEAAAEAAQDTFEAPAPQPSLSEMPFVSVRQADRPSEAAPEAGIQVPPPAAGRGSNRSGRVKTRLLGFNPEGPGLENPFEKPESRANDPFPVAWLVVVGGPGRGTSFPLHDGVARVGRGEDQTVCLNFGDNSISRENHVSVAYDSEQNAFYIGQSGRSNIVRLNNKPLLSTEQLRSGDQVRVGETTLRLVALCGDGFSWAASA
jgi:hypothetical protein